MKVFQYLNRSKDHPNWIHNWGDSFSADLMSQLSGQKYQITNDQTERGKILAAGSVMKATKAGDIVWGTGCIMPKAIGSKPDKVLAVRGPLTRQELINRGIECPKIYGDPALLMPMVFQPIMESRPACEYGLIPHYVDHDTEVVERARQLGIKIIDICQPTADLIAEMHTVEKLMSSSLHGLILADAYGIPNARVSITGKLVGKDFKFEDYYASVNRKVKDCTRLTQNTLIKDIEEIIFNDHVMFNQNDLLGAAPWSL